MKIPCEWEGSWWTRPISACFLKSSGRWGLFLRPWAPWSHVLPFWGLRDGSQGACCLSLTVHLWGPFQFQSCSVLPRISRSCSPQQTLCWRPLQSDQGDVVWDMQHAGIILEKNYVYIILIKNKCLSSQDHINASRPLTCTYLCVYIYTLCQSLETSTYVYIYIYMYIYFYIYPLIKLSSFSFLIPGDTTSLAQYLVDDLQQCR